MKKMFVNAVTLLLVGISNVLGAEPLSTAFSYQGLLAQDGQPASGVYDLRFAIYDSPDNGNPIAGPIVSSPVYVTNGLFATELDFGQAIFTGQALWLEISIRTNNTVEFVTLDPRQPLRPAPYALHALSAGSALTASSFLGVLGPDQLAGPYTNEVALTHPANQLVGIFSGDGTSVTNVNAVALGGMSPGGFWQTSGNTGTLSGTHFLGTVDEQPLELRVNNTTAFRLLPGNNVLGGAPDNVIASGVLDATISGGTGNRVESGAALATIGGGIDNRIDNGAMSATIAGGDCSRIGSGSSYAAIAGGNDNNIGTNAIAAFVGGGEENSVKDQATYAVVVGGERNTIQSNSQYAVIAGGRHNLIATNAAKATIAGGAENRIAPGAEGAFIGGGSNNYIESNAWFGTVPGGRLNMVAGRYGFAAGNRAAAMHEGTFVWADSLDTDFASTRPNQFLVRATGGVGVNTNQPQSALHVAGTITADQFRGSGSGLANVDADRLDGRHGDEFAPASHTHSGADITSGTIADARLSPNIPKLNTAQTFTGANQFTHAGNLFVGAFQGNGSALTDIDADKISAGTLADTRLSTNIPRLNSPANFATNVSAPIILANNLVADAANQNNAALAPGLVLGGANSGEGIVSKRTAGGNQYGLDLFTAFASRLAIANNGAIHVGAGNSFSAYGDARSSTYVLRGASTGSAYGELFLPGNQRVSVPVNSTWTFRVFVAGRGSNGKAAGYFIRGFVENENGSVRMLESPNTEDYAEDDTTWDVNVTANDAYDALVVTARGNTGDSVRWTAVIYTVEVKW